VSKLISAPGTFTRNPSATTTDTAARPHRLRDCKACSTVARAGSMAKGRRGIRNRGPHEPPPGQTTYSPKKTSSEAANTPTNVAWAACLPQNREKPHIDSATGGAYQSRPFPGDSNSPKTPV